MSLTGLVNSKNPIRNMMQSWFPKPKLELEAELIVPPSARDRSLIGIAFDYLLRFDLERRHGRAVTSPWIAQRSLGPARFGLSEYFPNAEVAEYLASHVAFGMHQHREFLKSGQITDELLRSVHGLALCDVYYRTRSLPDRACGDPTRTEIDELHELAKIIDRNALRADQICHLNPDFGIASRALGGADADILLDDCLIEIKTVEKLQVKVEDWRQLLGYAALNEHYPIGEHGSSPVRSIGIYFARHGYLAKWSLAHVVDRTKFAQFSLFLAKYVMEQYLYCLETRQKQDAMIGRSCRKTAKELENEYRRSRSASKTKKRRGVDRRSLFERTRRKYRPDRIAWLFIAEAPPSAKERFFYFEKVDSHDWLFLAIVRAFYADVVEMQTQEIRKNKPSLLLRLQSDGFFLVDSCSKPLSKRKSKSAQIRENVPALLEMLDGLREEGRLVAATQIALVSTTVFEECFVVLRDAGFGLANTKAIPFPSHGHQCKFADAMVNILGTRYPARLPSIRHPA